MSGARWCAVVPFKGRGASKTRLGTADREALARAFLLDTLAACARAPELSGVVLVTSDARAVTDALAVVPTLVVVADPGGLDSAVLAGAEAARDVHPDDGLLILLGDLPALVPEDLSEALRVAPTPLAVVADHAGTGTTALVLAPGAPLLPAFGAGSYARHRARGHEPVDLRPGSTLRLDVDTAADLEAARRAGAGPRTSAALDSSDERHGAGA